MTRWGKATVGRARRWGLGVTLLAVGCSEPVSSPGGSEPGAPTAGDLRLVELYSWWTAPGEAESLGALVQAHERRIPEARVFNAAAASGERARSRLRQRLTTGDPPDLFQLNAHDLREFAAIDGLKLQALGPLFERLGLPNVVYPELVRDVTLGGQLMAWPVNVHRENSLFYNVPLMAAHGLSPPQSTEELLRACERLKAAGVVPIAVAHQGWILRILFNSLAMGVMGAERYHSVFTGQEPPSTAVLRPALELFAKVLADYVNPDAGEEGFGWSNAVQSVSTGTAAMLLHGDWAKGYFLQLGKTPGVDFGVVAAPGAQELFLYGLDVFVMPTGAVNRPGAEQFLETVASTEAQVGFNSLKGSSPVRSDVPVAALDPLARGAVEDLLNAKVRLLVRARPEWDEAFSRFARDRDPERMLATFQHFPPLR